MDTKYKLIIELPKKTDLNKISDLFVKNSSFNQTVTSDTPCLLYTSPSPRDA